MKKINHILISHHLDSQLERCIGLHIFSNHIWVCTRCLGSLIGLVVSFFLFDYPSYFNLSALADWAAFQCFGIKGNNKIRFFSGFLIGNQYKKTIQEIITVHLTFTTMFVNVFFLFTYIAILYNLFNSQKLRPHQSTLPLPNKQGHPESAES
jgi:hypothetical protein